ncbi:spondin-2-like [Culicoides brevitarsis]|uniref:spondin-2-like n=1 Tax=Culicoides brevitarsis TaxID=469753 RepID=UPI00307BB427
MSDVFRQSDTQTSGQTKKCKNPRLALYNVTFVGNWSPDLFPKQYPEFRPPAQWSKTFGRIHNSNHFLFKLGKRASKGIVNFVDQRNSDILEREATNEDIFNDFSIPAISKGVGFESGKFLIDNEHPLVSLLSNIIPSPDWFVGVDSLMLCKNDRWIERLTIEAKPYDAGFESGLTFTAPVWQTTPQGPVKAITHKEPSHEASSFFYPELDELPPMGFYHFQKIAEFINSEHLKHHCASSGFSSFDFDFETDDEYSEKLTSTTMRSVKRRVPNREAYVSPDCQVGEWSAWSACSKACGIGETFRTRKVLKHPKRGGLPCPALKQTSWCGSSRDCSSNENYFRW